MKKNNQKVFLFIVAVIGILFVITIINKLQDRTKSSKTSFSQTEQIAPHYVEYSDTTLTKAKQSGKAVLFFAATKWCTTCSALDLELKKLSQTLPEDITVLKIDYDNDSQTKSLYQVTTQHTMILLDQNGREKKRWIGGNFDALVQNIN